MKKWILFAVLLIAASAGWIAYQKVNSKLVRITPELIEALHQTVAAENEAAISKPIAQPRLSPAPNPLKNVYFGDLHVHTAWSFDAFISGNRFDPDQAYRFARGEAFELLSGETVRIATPLDFVAVTDHAESFGLFEGCSAAELTPVQEEFCGLFDNPSLSLFLTLRNEAIQRPPIRPEYCGADGEFCIRHGRTTWQKIQAAADRAYEPGVFTSLYGYEYSPVWPKNGSTHRNVIFRTRTVPDLVVSAFDAETALDLWQALDESCVDDCEFITIPHNLNRYYGKAFSGLDEDGNAYGEADWVRRRRFEPLVEVFQAKGASECARGVGTTDEECDFEQFFAVCAQGEHEACAGPNSYARDGLKFGLTLEESLGYNPLRFGFIGSTDAHNSNPGDTEEWDYRGKSGLKDATAAKRLDDRGMGPNVPLTHNPGGLAAVWATENVREAIFDGLKSKETYATSGTRISLRVFASPAYDPQLLEDPAMIRKAYAAGVPMGGALGRDPGGRNLKLLVWATRDPASAPLDRIQLVKGWRVNTAVEERVLDIACSDGEVPDAITGRCPDNAATVDLQTCRISDDSGSNELKVLWEDDSFDPDRSAFYYVRVLQKPTCRWSTYDAIRLGIEPAAQFAPTVQERAWSSPIWYDPDIQGGSGLITKAQSLPAVPPEEVVSDEKHHTKDGREPEVTFHKDQRDHADT